MKLLAVTLLLAALVVSNAEDPTVEPVAKTAVKEGCSEVTCKMHCEYGYQADDKGCPVCKCNDKPVKGKCSNIVCMMQCEHGFVQDQSTGCDMCKCAEAKKHHGSHAWGYTGNLGPLHWGEMHTTCKSGTRQSPINIITADTHYDENLEDFAKFKDLKINEDPKLSMKILNDGHKINIGVDGSIIVRGGNLPADFQVAGIHFHWGRDDSAGSEHTVNGKAFPLEMHIVTFNVEKFETVGEALKGEDSLAVLGVLFQIQDDNNTVLEALVESFDEIVHPNGSIKVDIPTIAINQLLPPVTGKFFRYLGSLTTPGCNENVIWTVFSEPVGISSYQMQKFRELQREEGGVKGALVDNYRPVQSLQGRHVYASYMAAPPPPKETKKPDPGYKTTNSNKSTVLSASSSLVFIMTVIFSYFM